MPFQKEKRCQRTRLDQLEIIFFLFAYFVYNFFFKQNFEIRTYARNKYAMIKYQYVETENQDKKAKKSESKQGNDEVMKFVWKLMEYTQGSNEEKLCMKLIMPVFVGAETIERAYEGDQNKNLIEVTVFLSLPPEYQENGVEPPKPTDPTIIFEFIEGFKCFVG